MPAKETKPAPPKAAAAGAKKPAASKPAAKTASKSSGRPPKKAGVLKPLKKIIKKGVAAVKGVVKKGTQPEEKKGKKQGSQFKALYAPPPKRMSGPGQVQTGRKDLTRWVKWPRYIRIQRQRKVLYGRLKVPPAINQFSKTLDKNAKTALFKLLNKYRPEESQAKKKRLLEVAKTVVKGQATPDNLKKPLSIVHGANQVIKAIESKQAKLVVVAHDVDPIELVVAIPYLCRKVDIPYVIVKGKAKLGKIARRKTTTTLAITDVEKADKNDLASLSGIAREAFNENVEHRRQWGGGRLGQKSSSKIAEKQRAIAKEQAAREKAKQRTK